MKVAAAALLPAALLGLSGCIAIDAKGGPIEAVACAGGETRHEVAEMTFGRNIGQTLGVSDADFTRFLDEEVTPRFPEGLTVQDSEGRWLDKGVEDREPGKIVTLILAHDDDRAKLSRIAAAYEARFRQHAVLIRVHPECVLFHSDETAGY